MGEQTGFWKFVFPFLLVSSTMVPFSGGETMDIRIGAMLSTKDDETAMRRYVTLKNEEDYLEDSPVPIQLDIVPLIMQDNPIQSALSVCEDLITHGIHVVIVSHPVPVSEMQPPIAVSYTCGFYNIPVIGVSSREAMFSDKTVHPTFLRTVPRYSDQAKVWAGLANHYRWTKVVVITPSSQDGRSILATLIDEATKNNLQITNQDFSYTPGLSNATSLLLPILDNSTRVIMLYATGDDANLILETAQILGLFKTEFVWITNEEAMQERPIAGLIGTSLKMGGNEQAHINDAVAIVKKGFYEYVRQRGGRLPSPPPVNCKDNTYAWLDGLKIYNFLVRTVVSGETGQIILNGVGDRANAEYEVNNVRPDFTLTTIGTWKKFYEPTDSSPIWPGPTHMQPAGVAMKNHLHIVTVRLEPFVFVLDLMEPPFKRCRKAGEEAFYAKRGILKHDELPCYLPVGNISSDAMNYSSWDLELKCCAGYSMALLQNLSTTLNFTFDLYLAPDGSFGRLKTILGEDGKTLMKWNGAVGEVMSGRADLIVTALTISNERSKAIAFSTPYKHQGLSILVRKMTDTNKLASFLAPFSVQLWVLIPVSVHVVALLVYLLDRFSPFGRFHNPEGTIEADAISISSAMWFAWGVLLNSGIGEGAPRSFSARVLGIVWAGFAMIIVASYTANLAAFLVLERPESEIVGIDDARMRNPTDDFRYATVVDSDVEDYFKRKVEMSNMYIFMQQYKFANTDDAFAALIRGDLDAFIWDTSVLSYISSVDCSVMTVGDIFHRSGYGIGFPKDSPWKEKISMAILSLHENGDMEDYDSNYINIKNCEAGTSNSHSTLDLDSMGGVFGLVGLGVVGGIFMIFLEIAYNSYTSKTKRQLYLAKKTVKKWKKSTLRKKQVRQWHDAEERFKRIEQLNRRHRPTDPTFIYTTTDPAPIYRDVEFEKMNDTYV